MRKTLEFGKIDYNGTGRKINKVSENGLNQILLSPEVRSVSQNNIDFLRIFDAKKGYFKQKTLVKDLDSRNDKSWLFEL